MEREDLARDLDFREETRSGRDLMEGVAWAHSRAVPGFSSCLACFAKKSRAWDLLWKGIDRSNVSDQFLTFLEMCRNRSAVRALTSTHHAISCIMKNHMVCLVRQL